MPDIGTVVLPEPGISKAHLQACILTTLLYLGLIFVLWFISLQLINEHDNKSGLFTLGVLGSCRYGWLLTNIIRSFIYRFHSYPKLRAASENVESPFPERVHFIIPTYQEKPWVTRKMLVSVTHEAISINSHIDLYITTGGADEDQVVRDVLQDCVPNPRLTVHMMRQEGKRHGMAFALRAAHRVNGFERNSAVVLMDGDTLLGPGIMRRCLPFFALLPKVGGLTPNNVAVTNGPDWYRKWYALRFALRNRYMCSTSLSHKVLTLTGRFSIVRGPIAFSDEFIERVERDSIDDWLYGQINFKTGDDKSTWYTLLRNGWDMLYIPDAWIYCMENAGQRPLYESIGKLRRWFGNMLRNNGRALALGPKRTGLFAWLSLVDQRLSMWTSLMLPTGAIISIFDDSPLVLLFFIIWVISTRLLYLTALAIEGHAVSLWDIPLLIYQQWVGSFIKIQTLSDLRRQKWGAARGDAATGEDWFGTVQWVIWMVCFVLIVALMVV